MSCIWCYLMCVSVAFFPLGTLTKSIQRHIYTKLCVCNCKNAMCIRFHAFTPRHIRTRAFNPKCPHFVVVVGLFYLFDVCSSFLLLSFRCCCRRHRRRRCRRCHHHHHRHRIVSDALQCLYFTSFSRNLPTTRPVLCETHYQKYAVATKFFRIPYAFAERFNCHSIARSFFTLLSPQYSASIRYTGFAFNWKTRFSFTFHHCTIYMARDETMCAFSRKLCV